MKKSIFGRIAALTLVLSIITTCLLGRTLAAFSKTVDGQIGVPVANFNVAMQLKTDAGIVMDLARTKDLNERVNPNKIAPGDKGTFKVCLDFTEMETETRYTVFARPVAVAALPSLFQPYEEDVGILDFSKALTMGTAGFRGDIGEAFTTEMMNFKGMNANTFSVAEQTRTLNDPYIIDIEVDWKIENSEDYAREVDRYVNALAQKVIENKATNGWDEDEGALMEIKEAFREDLLMMHFRGAVLEVFTDVIQVLPSDN